MFSQFDKRSMLKAGRELDRAPAKQARISLKLCLPTFTNMKLYQTLYFNKVKRQQTKEIRIMYNRIEFVTV